MRRRYPAGHQQADFGRPPVDVEPEQQADQQQGRGDQEEAETKEKPVEIGPAGARLEAACPDIIEDEAALFRVEVRLKPGGEFLRGRRQILPGGRGQADRGDIAEAAAPEFLARFQRDIRFRRGAVFVPVFLVALLDALVVVGERRVPVA